MTYWDMLCITRKGITIYSTRVSDQNHTPSPACECGSPHPLPPPASVAPSPGPMWGEATLACGGWGVVWGVGTEFGRLDTLVL
jgi:hypothetical protein